MIARLIAAIGAALRALAHIILTPLRLGESCLRAIGIGPGQSSLAPPPSEAPDPGPSPEEIEANMRHCAAVLRALCANKAAGHSYVIPPDLTHLGSWVDSLNRHEAATVALARTPNVVLHLAGERHIGAIPPVSGAAGVVRWREGFLAERPNVRRLYQRPAPREADPDFPLVLAR